MNTKGAKTQAWYQAIIMHSRWRWVRFTLPHPLVCSYLVKKHGIEDLSEMLNMHASLIKRKCHPSYPAVDYHILYIFISSISNKLGKLPPLIKASDNDLDRLFVMGFHKDSYDYKSKRLQNHPKYKKHTPWFNRQIPGYFDNFPSNDFFYDFVPMISELIGEEILIVCDDESLLSKEGIRA